MKRPINFAERIAEQRKIIVDGNWYELIVSSAGDVWIYPAETGWVMENVMCIRFDWYNETYQVLFALRGTGDNFTNVFGLRQLYKENVISSFVFKEWLCDTIRIHQRYF